MKSTKFKLWSRLSRSARIDVVEVLRETKSTVTLADNTTERKHTLWHAYFDTWEEAHGRLMEIAEGDVKGARLRLQAAQGFLGNVKGMTKP